LRPWSRLRASSPRIDSEVWRSRAFAETRLCSLVCCCPVWMMTEGRELDWVLATSRVGAQLGRSWPVDCEPGMLVAGVVITPMARFDTRTGAPAVPAVGAGAAIAGWKRVGSGERRTPTGRSKLMMVLAASLSSE